MASAETTARAHDALCASLDSASSLITYKQTGLLLTLMAKDRHTRKRPFTGWMKRLANLKSSNATTDAPPNPSSKKTQSTSPAKSKKLAAKNNPYPQSGHFSGTANNDALSCSSPITLRSNTSFTSVEEGGNPGQQRAPAKSTKSAAPTVATNPETVHSARSKAETRNSNTMGGGSTFSSPNHSDRSLTTTLTTIQSTAPSNVLGGGHNQNAQPSNAPPVHFSHQFPTASPPPSAIPPHLALQPNSYQAATANNMLTDNASILTLASSSKRRRRNSLDTNASIRALAPSSVWGGSRESLPLSVLSANADAIYSPQNRTGMGAFANAERASIYSSSGIAAPALSGERSSYYANKQQNADGLSVRSGLLGHSRTDSITGSIGATNPTSPLASPRDLTGAGRMSRRSSEWKDAGDGSEVGDEGESLARPTTAEEEGKGKAKAEL